MQDARRTEFWACLALKHTPGLGPRSWTRLLRHYGSAYAAVKDAARWRAKALATEAVTRAFAAEAWREAALAEWLTAHAQFVVPGWDALLYGDPDYPARLKQIPDAPVMVYLRGDRTLLANPGVAVVGSRKAVERGATATYTLARRLTAAGLTVVSGLARGIDRQAHLGGLEGPGSTIAALGCGLDMVYPPENADLFDRIAAEGLLVSEFAPGVHPDRRHFPRRNRLISGLSLGVAVMQAAAKSGALITARQAMEQNREVFVFGGPSSGPFAEAFAGCARLLEEGATEVGQAEDILRELTPLLEAEVFPEGLDAPPVAQGLSEPADTEQASLFDGKHSPEKPSHAGGDWAIPETEAARDPHVPSPPPEPPVLTTRAPTPLSPSATPPGETSPSASAPGASAPASTARPEGDEARLLEALGEEVLHVDALAEALGWDAAAVNRTLVRMEMKGLVKQWPGMRYSGFSG